MCQPLSLSLTCRPTCTMLLRVSDRVTSPGRRRRKVSIRPSRSGAAHPISEYMKPPTDPLGRSISLSFSVIPDARRVANVIVGKGIFPFANEHDVWRWCVDAGLRELERRAQDADVTSAVSTLSTLMKSAATELSFAYFERIFVALVGSVRRLLKDGNVAKAESLAEEIWRLSDRIDDPEWQEKFRNMAKRELDRARKVARNNGSGGRV